MIPYRLCLLLFATCFCLPNAIIFADESRFCTDSNGECADCHSWCSFFLNSTACENIFVYLNCPATCNACSDDICSHLNCEQRCIPPANDNELPICDCLPGYELNENGYECYDINECEVNANICVDEDEETSSDCINTPGDYVCNNCENLGENVFSYYGERRGCCSLDKISTCGKSSTNTRLDDDGDDNDARVVGGEDTIIQRWPWQVYVRLANATYLCGGSLITSQWVLTAAHCLEVVGPSDTINILAGVSDLFDTTNVNAQRIQVASFYIHPDYDGLLMNDVGLLFLEREVEFSPFVQTICLPGGDEPDIGETCYVTGFGVTEQEANFSSAILQQADQKIQSDVLCNALYDYFLEDFNIFDPDTQICAGRDEVGRTPCFGDSGGPLVCQRCDSCDWYLVGVVSYGLVCGYPGIYAVYAQVSAYERWINSFISNQPIPEPQQCSRPYWGEWSEWTDCPVTCGSGLRTRFRTCQNGAAGEPDCIGSPHESIPCPALPRCEGQYSEWIDVSCSRLCGGGDLLQIRTCEGGYGCEVDGPSARIVELGCNLRPCSGGWSDFGPWSECTFSCGGGTQERTRDCLEPTGTCDGSTVYTETRVCNPEPCVCPNVGNAIGVYQCCEIVDTRPELCTSAQELSEYLHYNCAEACCRVNANPPQNCLGGAPPLQNRCPNNYPDSICNLYASDCGNPVVKSICPRTCNACPPTFP